MLAFAPKLKATQHVTLAKPTLPRSLEKHETNSVLYLQRTIGNRAVQQLLKANSAAIDESGPSTGEGARCGQDFSRKPISARAQSSAPPKLAIAPGNTYHEQEANRIADQIMSMPQHQRTCACGGGYPRCQAKKLDEVREPLQLQRKEGHGITESTAPFAVYEALSFPGRPLDSGTRDFMGTRFGHDFSKIRVHTDERAAASAEAINAYAYTAGRNIVFGAQQYAPETDAGRRLLAHELAHVVQQGHAEGRTAAVPMIQRQARGSQTGGAAAGSQATRDASVRQTYIDEACAAIMRIRTAIEGGWVWPFENESLLQGDEWLRLQQRTLVDVRRNALQQLVQELDSIIGDLESGAMTPPAVGYTSGVRLELGEIVRDRMAPLIFTLPLLWIQSRVTHSRVRGREKRAIYLDSFVDPVWPPRILQPASFPTWPISGCDAQQPAPRQGPVPISYVRENELPRNTVIFVSGWRDGRPSDWYDEPRHFSRPEDPSGYRHRSGTGYHIQAAGTPYEWHDDVNTRRVFIVINGQRFNLLRNQRLELQEGRTSP